jgi:hypothetical protein
MPDNHSWKLVLRNKCFSFSQCLSFLSIAPTASLVRCQYPWPSSCSSRIRPSAFLVARGGLSLNHHASSPDFILLAFSGAMRRGFLQGKS